MSSSAALAGNGGGKSFAWLCHQLRRGVLDAAVRCLQIYVNDPLVQDLVKRAEHDDGVFAGIVIVAFQDVAECRAGDALHQIVIHMCLYVLPHFCCVKTVSEPNPLEPFGLTVERRADSPDCCNC